MVRGRGWDVGGNPVPPPQGPLRTRARRPAPALAPPPVLSEWLAAAQGQPCDPPHPDFPSVSSAEGLGTGILRRAQNRHVNWI